MATPYKTVAFHTLGCKLNYSESSAIARDFNLRGFKKVNFNESADVYVINTCTVTENANRDCRKIVKKAIRQSPDAFIAIMGCYAQLKPKELSKIPGVDVVFGIEEKFSILDQVKNNNGFVKPLEEIGIGINPNRDFIKKYEVSD